MALFAPLITSRLALPLAISFVMIQFATFIAKHRKSLVTESHPYGISVSEIDKSSPTEGLSYFNLDFDSQEPPIALSTDRDIHFYFSNGGPDSFSIFIWHQTECTLWSWTQKGDELKLMDSMDLSSSGFWRATRYLWKVHGLCLMTHSRSASSLKMNNSIFSLRSLTSKFFSVFQIFLNVRATASMLSLLFVKNFPTNVCSLVDIFVNFMAGASLSVNLSFLQLLVMSSILRNEVWYLVGIWVYGGCSSVKGNG